jgi:hypothetical protein
MIVFWTVTVHGSGRAVMQLTAVQSEVAEQAFSRVGGLRSLCSYMTVSRFVDTLLFYMCARNRQKHLAMDKQPATFAAAHSAVFQIERWLSECPPQIVLDAVHC